MTQLLESESKDVEMDSWALESKSWKEARPDSWVLEMKMKQIDPWALKSETSTKGTPVHWTQLERTRKWKWNKGLPASWSLESESKSKYALEH